MSATNALTLAQLDRLDVKGLSEVPTDQIVTLLEVVGAKQKCYAARAGKLNAAIAARYTEATATARRAAGKDTGTVRIVDGEFVVIADAPKKVEWDQTKLRAVHDVLRDQWKENPLDYMKVTFGVEEKKYTSWPPMIRKLFDDARTVSAGTHKFTVEPVSQEAA